MADLRGELMRFVPSPEGRQAELFLVEPDGNEVQVRCLILPDGGCEIYPISGNRAYERLVEYWGSRVVVGLARGVVESGG